MRPHRPPRSLTHLVSQVEHRLTARLRAALEPDGASIEEWRVLDLLSDAEGHTMSELAEYALLLAPTLTKLVDRLVSDNLVYRRADAEDRRRVRAYLTPRGQDRYLLLRRRVAAHEAELAGSGALAGQLSDLCDSLDERPRTTAR
ncbi:MarR family winged helix-turn-helix transcriptional regulator [Amycolatopsis alkalitolerans]|uniref:MarR family transcriptional regulator n=1 Tax=Amycolatopsis alkalitolerans TaxID=2547244 RepID=A0A5C4LTR9_9PSEU|nr:MarR family transcriptional regulator [Amycolatopsis alkalitolerans]TNC22205.1 MarR family transcriptional regulator [Amycolatopsis alkalitolerans]